MIKRGTDEFRVKPWAFICAALLLCFVPLQMVSGIFEPVVGVLNTLMFAQASIGLCLGFSLLFLLSSLGFKIQNTRETGWIVALGVILSQVLLMLLKPGLATAPLILFFTAGLLGCLLPAFARQLQATPRITITVLACLLAVASYSIINYCVGFFKIWPYL